MPSPNINSGDTSAPPLDPIALRMLLDLTADDPTVRFLEREASFEAERHLEDAREAREVMQEEIDYQRGIAQSLGLPYTTPHVPSTSAGPLTVPVGPSVTPSNTVTTIPYKPKTITAHLNSTWMRPTVDNTAKPRRATRINLDNHFYIVFWGQAGKPPVVHAIHECPQWPKWILMDAGDVREELGIRTKMLEFYNVPRRQWVGCSPSYPHDVKKDGHLFLRHYGVVCDGFEEQLKLATTKLMHFHDNQPGE
ncbi:hypothetical protein NLJ89_g10344 [Agrocybe chaxingu]|uniref:Uncharacterized protein n=1 Tax=Agrocybe chaxingu TaxID=84603 RepID=A0A9W8MR05_9AGAR|nr:hypothetical protein NLJ89_g10344 [Agrocybe chaxingu]